MANPIVAWYYTRITTAAIKCIILCTVIISYNLLTSKSTKKRKPDKLVSAETIDGGKLREAATAKNDQKILVHILDNDCVALEVKYHKRCYERYTSCVRHASPEVEEKYESCKYIKSFESFSHYVKQEIVDGHRFIYMRELRNKFVETVRVIDNEDSSNYKAFRLKRRLRNRFPQLVFYQPRRRFTSEIVFAEDISKGAVAERALNSEGQDDWDKIDSDEDEEEVTVGQRVDDKKIKLKELCRTWTK